MLNIIYPQADLVSKVSTMFHFWRISKSLMLTSATSLILISCGGEQAGMEQDDQSSNDIPFAYVERQASVEAQANVDKYTNALAQKTEAPLEVNSPYEFRPGAKLIVRSSLDMDALTTEVLTNYFGSSDFDVKDLNTSEDGSTLVFSAHGPVGHPTDSSWNIYEYDFNSETIRRVIVDDAVANAGQDTSPTYSPDGLIVFSSDRAAGNPSSPVNNVIDTEEEAENCVKVSPNERPSLLHSMTEEGENIVQLTYGNNHDLHPFTLNDGKVVFVRWSRSYELVSHCGSNFQKTFSESVENDEIFQKSDTSGLSKPSDWSDEAICQFAIETEVGAVVPTNHYTVLRITSDGENMEQLYDTVSVGGSDEAFLAISKIKQAENGKLVAILQHEYNQFLGGNPVELQSPQAYSDTRVFGKLSPQSIVNGEVDLYPNQVSIKGWYSALDTYRDGSQRALVSWSKCTTLNDDNISSFCDSRSDVNAVDSRYGLWVVDNKDMLPLVRSKSDTVYTDIAIAQPNNSASFPYEPFNADFEDNLDSSQIICNDPSVYVPTPTPAPTWEPTPTPEVTPTPTSTPVVVETPTPTTTPVVVVTPTPVFTIEPTATPAPTVEPTATPAPTVEPTATPAPTVEPTATPTVEPTATPAPTVEPTATPTPTVEPTATPAPTVEPTATPAPTVEPTATPAPTVEPTATPAPTVEPTATPAPTVEPTATPAPTVEPTATPAPPVEPTATPEPTVEPTATPAPPVEPTATPEPTVEPTATPAPTVEPTATPAPTIEPTATPAPTVEPTATPAPTATPEPTATPNPTPEPTIPPEPCATQPATPANPNGPGERATPADPADPCNRPPHANAGENRVTRVGELVVLDGSESSDPDSNLISYEWSVVDEEVEGGITLTLPDSASPVVTANSRGSYTLQLQVNDGVLSSESDLVEVVVENTPPIARAGRDREQCAGDEFRLNGSRSGDADGDAINYSWSVIGDSVDGLVLTNVTAERPNVEVLKPGEYRVQLIVDDGELESQPDELVITVANRAPVADAGADQPVHAGSVVELDGSNSTDADGDALTYSWVLVESSAEGGITMTGADLVRPNVNVNVTGTYRIQLTVNDGELSSEVDEVVLTADNIAPVADAGDDQASRILNTVVLDGSESRDADNDVITYRWSIIESPAGSSAQLASPEAMVASFTPDLYGRYRVQLIVNDGYEDSEADIVVIDSENVAPVANAGADQEVDAEELVTLDGSLSSDHEGDVLTFEWNVISQPEGSELSVVDNTSESASLLPSVAGTYVVQLTVSDGELSDSDTMVVEVTASPFECEVTDSARSFPTILRDFSDSHPDFEYEIGAEEGIVADELGEDGLPVYANPDGHTLTTTGKEAFDQWYRDIEGVNTAIPTEFTMYINDEGNWEYRNFNFFPLDDLGFGNEGRAHNYHFTLESHMVFDYEGGERFLFAGDDDLYVFINGKLAIDIGGVHGILVKEIFIDDLAEDLGIEPGNRYTFDIFFAERHTVKSTFKFQTNINFECGEF